MRPPQPLLTVVAPMSVQTWYQQFAGDGVRVLFVGEEPEETAVLADRIAEAAGGDPVRILSGHDSLERDHEVAVALRANGMLVASQSTKAVAAGADKVLQKRVLEGAGVAIPDWGLLEVAPSMGSILVKGRSSTQSRGLRWWTPADAPVDGRTLNEGFYWEAYVDGIEFSVVVHRGSHGSIVFPPVWKGRVLPDLTPPWRRMRLVPGPAAATHDDMIATAEKVARLLDVREFVEVEFIVPADGAPVVTDINPRISGTMRIVAMATGLPIFDPELSRSVAPAILSPRMFAAELPYEGVAFATERAVASSRLTCAGESPAAVRRELGRYLDVDALPWPEDWSED